MPVSAAIYGCAGPRLSDEERRFFADTDPWGFILFARNIENPQQVSELTSEMRDLAGRDVPILIDQEGGRVARLKPPYWRAYPPARRYGDLYAQSPKDGLEATWLASRLMAAELLSLGINVDCLPVLDVPVLGAHDVIGDRAYGETPDVVSTLGRAAAEGLLAGGVLPVLKHIPGHGRAGADSHLSLPDVKIDVNSLLLTDFLPFQALSDFPLAMTAHVVYSAIDASAPATTSRIMVSDIMRGVIGFDGLLMSDDLSMQALSGTLNARAKASFKAGCDLVLHCNGKMAEMLEVAHEVPVLAGDALRRSQAALDRRGPAAEFDEAEGWARFQTLMRPFC